MHSGVLSGFPTKVDRPPAHYYYIDTAIGRVSTLFGYLPLVPHFHGHGWTRREEAMKRQRLFG